MSKHHNVEADSRDSHPQLSAAYLTKTEPRKVRTKSLISKSGPRAVMWFLIAIVFIVGLLIYAFVIEEPSFNSNPNAWLETHWKPIGLTLGLSIFTLYPVLSYLYFSWSEKRYEILNSLTIKGKEKYLCLFLKDAQIDPRKSIEDQFAEMYDYAFGRWKYAIPVVALFCAVAGDVYVLASDLFQLTTAAEKLSIAAGATTGAYTYVTFDLILRQQRRDLSPADVLRGALRLAIGIPLGIAFGWVLDSDKAFLAFSIGVFPLDTIALVLRKLLNKKLELQIGVDGGDDQVATLSGVDQPSADRIQQADITTISQLAWCDPVQLSMRSNLSFAYVTDIVSQALAWVYFTKKLPDLAPLGLRGAFEIRSLCLAINSDDPDEAQNAQAVLALAATTLGIGVEGTKNAFAQIADDPCTIFIYDTF